MISAITVVAVTLLPGLITSPVAVHTVVLHTDEGFVLECKCYKHDVQPEPEPNESE